MVPAQCQFSIYNFANMYIKMVSHNARIPMCLNSHSRLLSLSVIYLIFHILTMNSNGLKDNVSNLVLEIF